MIRRLKLRERVLVGQGEKKGDGSDAEIDRGLVEFNVRRVEQNPDGTYDILMEIRKPAWMEVRSVRNGNRKTRQDRMGRI